MFLQIRFINMGPRAHQVENFPFGKISGYNIWYNVCLKIDLSNA